MKTLYIIMGVTEDGDLFFKGKYINTLPFLSKIHLKDKYISYNYFKEICRF